MPIEIILPAGTERVTVREIPELFATAIFPEVPRGTPRQVIDVKKMPLTEHNKLHWCGRGVQPFPVRLTAEDIAELWPSLPKLRLPIDEDKWQPYADAFARSNIIDWDLRVITEDPELVRIIVSEDTKEKRWQGIKDAVRNGELIPRSPITHMPEPDAIGEALKDCFVFVENLREYAARDGIIVSVRSGDNQTYADPSGATEKAAPEGEILRKRSALIAEFSGIWTSVESDLRDGSKNGLSAVANDKHGYWKVRPALNWAGERGKIQREQAAAFVRAKGESELSVLVRAMLDSK